MADKNTEDYTACPYTGLAKSWTEIELDNGNWRGDSSADGSTILADSWEGLRLRYGKINNARLESLKSKENE